MAKLDRKAWSRFVHITKPFFHSEMRWKAIGLFALLIGLLLSVSGLNVLNSFVGRDFMTSLEKQQAGRFYVLALKYAAVFGCLTLVAVCARFCEERLGLMWRAWLTKNFLSRYLASRTYYHLSSRGDVDNPDQRIAEDIKTFTTTALSFVLILINSTIALTAFSGILWSITPWLVVGAVGYAVFGSLFAVLLGRRLVGLDIDQLKKEADFRYDLIRVREHAERVALLGGEGKECSRLQCRLGKLVDNFKRIVSVNRNLGFFTTGYNYMIQVIPILIVAPLYINSRIEFGTVTQAAMAFGHVLGAFSLIVVEFQRITSFAAVVARLGSFEEVIEATQVPAQGGIETVADDTRVAFEELTLRTPREGRLLLDGLSLEVPEGSSLLITGPRGVGCSSLLRAAAGLWKHGSGRVCRPAQGMLFLPQQSYLVAGSLRDQLLYAAETEVADEQLMEVLQEVGLEPVWKRVGGLDAECTWDNVLSRGEQQMLTFARLLLARPRFAFLDDATSALDPAWGQHLYELLARQPITYISVGSDPGLRDYHDRILELRGNGAWVLVPRAQVLTA